MSKTTLEDLKREIECIPTHKESGVCPCGWPLPVFVSVEIEMPAMKPFPISRGGVKIGFRCPACDQPLFWRMGVAS